MSIAESTMELVELAKRNERLRISMQMYDYLKGEKVAPHILKRVLDFGLGSISKNVRDECEKSDIPDELQLAKEYFERD